MLIIVEFRTFKAFSSFLPFTIYFSIVVFYGVQPNWKILAFLSAYSVLMKSFVWEVFVRRSLENKCARVRNAYV